MTAAAAPQMGLSESKVPVVLIVCAIFMVHTVVVVALRLYSRLAIVRAVGADDILIIIAAIFAEVFCVIIIISTKYGLGEHIANVPPEHMMRFLQAVWASALAYNSTIAFIKASSLALYLRLTPNTGFRRLVIIMFGIVIAQWLSNIFTVIFQCLPVNYMWEQTIPGKKGSCINVNMFYILNSAFSILTDFMTYTLPMPTLWSLKMPRQQKIALCGILGLGGFAVLSSILRITYVIPMLTSTDPTWVIAEPMYWSVIEANIGILAISVPSYRVLARRFFPKAFSSSSPNSSNPYYGKNTGASGGYGLHSYGGDGRGIGMNTTIKGGGDGINKKAFGSTSNESEEMILKGAVGVGGGEVPMGKIVVTDDVRMEVHGGK